MRKKVSIFIFIGLLILMTFLPLAALANVHYNNIYNSTFNWSVYLESNKYQFDGRNIGIDIDCRYAVNGPPPLSNTYFVELRRPRFFGYTLIGRVEFPIDGFKSYRWYNQEPGNYYFAFIKKDPNCRANLYSYSVKMYSFTISAPPGIEPMGNE